MTIGVRTIDGIGTTWRRRSSPRSSPTSVRRPSGESKTVVVVMGVTGSGKTTVGRVLAERLGWRFGDADDFHTAANVAKMGSGTPLTDQDRWPWLDAIRDWLDSEPDSTVVTCSALRRRYRDVLRKARGRVRFLSLNGSVAELEARLCSRTDHFMLVTMLTSQLEALEPLEADEDGIVALISRTPGEIADEAIAAFQLGGAQSPT